MINPTGICQCGCGGQTNRAKGNYPERGVRTGDFMRFISGHQNGTRPDYVEAVPFKIDGEPCRLLPLTMGYYAIVSALDYERLWNYKWYASPKNCGVYAARNSSRMNKAKSHKIYLHHEVLGKSTDPKLTHTDHKNHLTLDCRRSNLRWCTQLQNNQHMRRHKPSRSGFRGVLLAGSNKFRVHVKQNCKYKYIGTFYDLVIAARAYDRAAIEAYGEFAITNFPIEDYQGEAHA
jgi:hypothetical protein